MPETYTNGTSPETVILLGESVPRPIKTRLPEFSIRTVQEMGCAGLKNGELLALAEREFDVLITADKNLRYQQSLTGRKLAVIVLPSNQVTVIVMILPAIREILEGIQPGQFVEIPSPKVR